MYHSFLIHSSADGHLGCFHVLDNPIFKNHHLLSQHEKNLLINPKLFRNFIFTSCQLFLQPLPQPYKLYWLQAAKQKSMGFISFYS